MPRGVYKRKFPDPFTPKEDKRQELINTIINHIINLLTTLREINNG